MVEAGEGYMTDRNDWVTGRVRIQRPARVDSTDLGDDSTSQRSQD